jgi:tRNA(fMet)-specific endonuclease VapC
MIVLDTNTLIYFFKRQGRVAERLLAQPPREIGVPTIVIYELEVGIAKSTSPEKRRRQLTELLAAVTVLPFGATEAQQAARIRAELERAGEPIGPYDILIAATALAHGGRLATRNVKEFGRVPGLSLEDWY